MPLLKVDTGNVFEAVVNSIPTQGQVTEVLRGLGSAARTEWVRQAQSGLRGTARDYIQGIGEVEQPDSNMVSITLSGVLPNMVENGWGAHDLRKTIIPNAKTRHMSKEGHAYVHIPFRHGTPGTSGKNVGPAMPTPIHNVAKHLMAARTGPRGQFLAGQRLTSKLVAGKIETAHGRAIAGLRKAQDYLQTKAQPWHATSLYSGMVKEKKLYEKSSQSKYMTFRTISENTQPSGRSGAMATNWMHPGINPRRYSNRVQRYVGTMTDKIMGMVMGQK